MLVELDKAKEAVADVKNEVKELRDELARQVKVSLGALDWSTSIPKLDQKIADLENCQVALGLAAGDTIDLTPDSVAYKAMMAVA